MVEGFGKLADAIMVNCVCLYCFEHYVKSDEAATCPKCGLSRGEQIKRYMGGVRAE